MSSLRWHHRPKLRRPTLVAAFEGWNDAGDAASGAARWLADRVGAEQVGVIEAEDFFDFTTTRPMVSTDDNGKRRLTWPDTEIWAAHTDGPTDLVFLIGQEPHLRWRTYCLTVTRAAEELGVSSVLTLGALLGDIPHTYPTVVTGTSDDPDAANRLGVTPSSYEGPTGIVGVLRDACDAASISSSSLWASVPAYVSGAPSPKATLALVERAMTMLGVSLPTSDLKIAVVDYVRQIDQMVSDDEDTAAYVANLEDAARERIGAVPEDLDGDFDPNARTDPRFDSSRDDGIDLADTDAEALVEEVEKFLRGD